MIRVGLEPGLYHFPHLDGEKIVAVYLSSKPKTISVATASGLLFVISVTPEGDLEAVLTDITDIGDGPHN